MLLTIFPELQLEIARFLTDPSDCAALCLAVPRGLGLAALRHRELPQYKDILVSVAMRLATGELQIDEALLRQYLWDQRRMTPEGCEWLTAAAQRAESPLGIVRSVLQGNELWHLTVGGAEGALVRRKQPRDIIIAFYKGEKGAERVVRMERPGAVVAFFEGERGAERKVRLEGPDGTIVFFEGEKGAERKVRVERPDGGVIHYAGERGAERIVRGMRPDGSVIFLYGEKGAERLVRAERPDGTAAFFEGARGAEGRVREEHPDGRVFFFEGEKGAERLVREELPDGTAIAH